MSDCNKSQEALRTLDDASMLHRDALTKTIFSDWAYLDFEEAIKSAANLVGTQRNVALEAILKSRDDLPADKRRAIAVQFEREETYDKLISDEKALHSTTNPSELWDILLNDEVDDLQQMETLAIVADAWREQIGFEILSKIYHSEIRDHWIKRRLTAAIVRGNPALALDYTNGVSENYEKSYLSHKIAKEWARTDPLAALAAVSTFEPYSLVIDLEEEIAGVWARTKPYELIGNIELLSEESRVSPLELALSYIAREDPLAAIESLSSVETSVGNTSTILQRIVDEWGMLQPEAATDWVLENVDQEDKKLRHSLLKEVLPSLVRQDPRKAFEIALAQPTPAFSSGLESQVILHLTLDGNIDLAISLLPRVRDRSRDNAYGHIASAMVKKGRTAEALELGGDLDSWLQKSYYRDVVQAWAGADPTGLYASLDDLPSSAARKQAVSALFFNNDVNPVFTNDQLEQAKSLLHPDDAAQIHTGSVRVRRSIPRQ